MAWIREGRKVPAFYRLLKCRILQGFISISWYRSFLLIYYIFYKKVQNEANHFRL